ncbi:hypothetical protein Tco_0386906 [Tanacetum coccineum]
MKESCRFKSAWFKRLKHHMLVEEKKTAVGLYQTKGMIKVDSNVILDSPNMCDNDILTDQNVVECDDERVALANLIANLKLDVDENKKIQKTKKPKEVSISTRKPKSQANKSAATPPKKTVASESTIQKSKSYYRMLYEKTSEMKESDRKQEKKDSKSNYLKNVMAQHQIWLRRTIAGVDIDTLTMEQYLALSRENQAPSMVKPKIKGNVNFEIKRQFMREFSEDSFSKNKNEDAHDHIDRGPIPGMTLAQALIAIQTMADHSQKWHDGTTSRNIGSSSSNDGLAALVNKLDNLGRDIKKLKESVHAIQVGCQICEGPHLDKDCPLNEEVKQVEEVRYGEFG